MFEVLPLALVVCLWLAILGGIVAQNPKALDRVLKNVGLTTTRPKRFEPPSHFVLGMSFSDRELMDKERDQKSEVNKDVQ